MSESRFRILPAKVVLVQFGMRLCCIVSGSIFRSVNLTQFDEIYVQIVFVFTFVDAILLFRSNLLLPRTTLIVAL